MLIKTHISFLCIVSVSSTSSTSNTEDFISGLRQTAVIAVLLQRNIADLCHLCIVRWFSWSCEASHKYSSCNLCVYHRSVHRRFCRNNWLSRKHGSLHPEHCFLPFKDCQSIVTRNIKMPILLIQLVKIRNCTCNTTLNHKIVQRVCPESKMRHSYMSIAKATARSTVRIICPHLVWAARRAKKHYTVIYM